MHVLLVDDHALFRSGLRCLLSELDAGLSFAEAGRLADALSHRGPPVDLILLDPALPDRGGIDAIARLRAALPTAALVVFSEDDEPTRVRDVLDAGASRFVRKASSSAELVAALRDVLGLVPVRSRAAAH
ncbi:MAG: hypothetical protein RJA99_4916 [Pseudomonadota bacterium]|jgi:DNA-binding NarL/FixJ family response regulator